MSGLIALTCMLYIDLEIITNARWKSARWESLSVCDTDCGQEQQPLPLYFQLCDRTCTRGSTNGDWWGFFSPMRRTWQRLPWFKQPYSQLDVTDGWLLKLLKNKLFILVCSVPDYLSSLFWSRWVSYGILYHMASLSTMKTSPLLAHII